MAKQFRAMPLYINNKKVAEIEEASLKFMTNGEQQVGFEEVLGESTGIVTVEGSFSTVTPVTGTEIDMVGLMLSQAYVSIGALTGGKTYKLPDAKITEAEVKTTSKTGVVKGSFTFRSGRPQVI